MVPMMAPLLTGSIAGYGDGIEVVIPPRSTAVPSGDLGLPTQRDHHLAMITEQGRLSWQVATDYGQRSLVEPTMGRYKALIGPRLRARGFAAQQTEAAIGTAVLNRMLAAGRPKSVRVQRVIAWQFRGGAILTSIRQMHQRPATVATSVPANLRFALAPDRTITQATAAQPKHVLSTPQTKFHSRTRLASRNPAARCPAQRSASAVTVLVGFTTPPVAKLLPSTI